MDYRKLIYDEMVNSVPKREIIEAEYILHSKKVNDTKHLIDNITLSIVEKATKKSYTDVCFNHSEVFVDIILDILKDAGYKVSIQKSGSGKEFFHISWNPFDIDDRVNDENYKESIETKRKYKTSYKGSIPNYTADIKAVDYCTEDEFHPIITPYDSDQSNCRFNIWAYPKEG